MKISVVIPTLDEAQQVGAAVDTASADAACAFSHRPGRSSDLSSASPLSFADSLPGQAAGEAGGAPESVADLAVEVWVVDGGSRDATAEKARQSGARVIESERGRARQLQRGVQETDGDVVLFLHADTRLPAGWGRGIRNALADHRVCGGAFRFRFDEPRDWRLRLIESGANLRARWLGMPYGDQAIFARRSVLERIGGVPQAPLMEDLDLVRALKRHGRLALVKRPVVTSSRRYQAAGPLRTAARHIVAAVAWAVGIDRQRIASWYGRSAARGQAFR